MKRVHIPRVTGHSLNKINEDIKNSLKNDLDFVSGHPADVLIQHYVSGIGLSKKYGRKILIQPIDGTRINPRMVSSMNNFDLILAPAEASKRIMESEGVKRPIRIVPNYYDDDLLDEKSNFFERRYPEKKYTFYSETTGIKRKNVDNILRYFLEEFSGTQEAKNVRLVLKLSSGDKTKMNTLEKIKSEYTNAPEVDIYNHWLNNEDLNSLRRGIDCYITLSYMEGFCIPLLNAAVLKKDIICMNSTISGYMDFINSNNAILIPVKKIPIDSKFESLLIYDKSSIWEEPIYGEYRSALRKAFSGTYNFKKDQDYSNFSKASVMQKYLEEILGREPLMYCITRDKRWDEYLGISRDLERIGVVDSSSFEFAKTVENQIKRHGVLKNSPANYELQSHLNVLRSRTRSKMEYSLICEDDILVVRDDEKLDDIVNRAPSDWDVIFLGGMNHFHNPIRVNKEFYKCRYSFNAHSYIVRNSFIPRLITELEKREAECDVIFAKMQETGIGNWYGLCRDMIIPSGKDKPRFIKVFPRSYKEIGSLKNKTGNLQITRISSYAGIKGIKYIGVRGSSGYSNSAKDYILGINELGVPITPHLLKHDESSYLTGSKNSMVNSLSDNNLTYDNMIIHMVPDNWPREVGVHWKEGVQKIGYFVWEADKLPTEWIESFKYVDKIAVPCEWNKHLLEKSGFDKPIGVIPHIYNDVKPSSFNIDGLQNEFVFYTIGQFTGRKGIKDTIRSFLGAFTSEDNVALVVKTGGYEYIDSERNRVLSEIQSIVSEFPNPAKVIPIVRELSDENIAYIHSIGDCFVSLSKAEGWGLGMFDATLKGKPVICTGYGGQLDFTCGPYINYEMGPINDSYKWFNEEQNWAYPDISHGSLLMRNVYENIGSYRNIALEHSKKITEKFSSENVSRKFLDFILS